VPVLRPSSVPNPTASNATVHAFLTHFLLSQKFQCTLDDAQERAGKLNVNGKALHELPEKELTDKLGMEGRTIYRALKTSKYGYVS